MTPQAADTVPNHSFVLTDEQEQLRKEIRDFAARDPEGNRWSFGTYRGEPRKP